MKRILPVFVAIIAMLFTNKVEAQLNYDFEAWTTTNPDDWTTYNIFMQFGCPQSAFEETASPAQGSSAIDLNTVEWVGGAAMIGTDTIPGFMQQQAAYAQKPSEVSFMYQSLPAGTDQSFFYLALTHWDGLQTVTDGYAMAFYDATTTGWTAETLPISYISADMPDSILIMGGSSASVIFGYGSGLGLTTYGSQALFDDIQLNTSANCANMLAYIDTSLDDNCGWGGVALAGATGGVGPYTYMWEDGTSDIYIDGLSGGTYDVTATDQNGCEAIATATIGSTAPMSLTVTQTTAGCGASDGTATVSITSGGTAPFNFLWTNGDQNITSTGLAAGVALVTVTDANGCMDVEGIGISNSNAPVINIAWSPVTCAGDSDGSVSVVATGGTPPYTYEWEDYFAGTSIGNTATVNNLPGGVYVVTVTDSNSPNACLAVDGGELWEADTMDIVTTGVDVTAVGAGDGEAFADVSGGATPYNYAWSDGQGTALATGLDGGSYNIVVIDAFGCMIADNISISEPAMPCSIALSMSAVNDNCGWEDGEANVVATNGTAPYDYEWDNGEWGTPIWNLAQGTYMVTVTDDNGCSEIGSVDVLGNDPIDITIDVTDPTCGNTDGSVDAIITGGALPYTYQWSNLSGTSLGTTSSLSNLGAGVVFLTVTDNNGCVEWDGMGLSNAGAPVITITNVQVSCDGNDGEVSVTIVSGGTAPFTYNWSNLDGSVNYGTDATVTGLGEGIYIVTVTDADGCVAIDGMGLDGPSFEVDAWSNSDVSCFGADDGEAHVETWGGTSPYTYAWSNGTSDQTAIDLIAGEYMVTVTDGGGCTDIGDVWIDEPDQIEVDINTVDATCGTNIGEALASATSGIAPFDYLWDNGINNDEITGLAFGIYEVTVTDDDGCWTTATAVVSASDGPQISDITVTDASCFDDSDGSAIAAVTGGTAPYTYLWDNGSTTNEANGLAAGNYALLITDGTGCQGGDIVWIDEPEELFLSVFTTDVTTFGGTDGGASLDVLGGTLAYSYNWSDGSSAATATGLAAGTVNVTVTDANGCSVSGSGAVSQPSAIFETVVNTIDFTVFPNPNNGTFEINVSGLKGDYKVDVLNILGELVYTENVNTTNSRRTYSLQDLQSGAYFFSITGANTNRTKRIIIK